MYIDANEALSLRIDDNTGDMFALGWNRAIAKVTTEIPKADVEPVVHAHWTLRTWDHTNGYFNVMEYPYRCSACHGKSKELTKRCPECGARMDEEEKR